MQNARSCTFLTKCRAFALFLYTSSPTTTRSPRTSRTTPEALVSSHIRVDVSRAPMTSNTYVHISRAQTANHPSRLSGFASKLLRSCSKRSHQLAVSKALRPETYMNIHTCTPTSSIKAMQQRGSIFLSYLRIILSSHICIQTLCYARAFQLSSF